MRRAVLTASSPAQAALCNGPPALGRRVHPVPPVAECQRPLRVRWRQERSRCECLDNLQIADRIWSPGTQCGRQDVSLGPILSLPSPLHITADPIVADRRDSVAMLTPAVLVHLRLYQRCVEQAAHVGCPQDPAAGLALVCRPRPRHQCALHSRRQQCVAVPARPPERCSQGSRHRRLDRCWRARL